MNEIVGLQLRDLAPEPPPDSSVWRTLTQNILRVISEASRDTDSKETIQLRAQITGFRSELGRPMHPQEERRVAADCVGACEHYLRRLQQDHTSREAELVDMVGILREAAARLIGDSSDFNTQLISSAGRLKMMSGLEDIRDLKKQLSVEVTSLERVVEDKKARDEAAVSKLSERVQVLQADLIKAEEQASTDALTKIPNRGTFDRTLAKMIEASRKANSALTLAMIDVDHFKKVNDTHGHPIGDRVLICTAEWLRTAIRHTDFVARYGGEEFAMLLDGADLAQAEVRLKQVLEEISTRSFEYEMNGERRSVRFTVSCGVSQLQPQDSGQDLVQRADQGLYEAKQKGRNRVVTRKPSRFARLLSRS